MSRSPSRSSPGHWLSCKALCLALLLPLPAVLAAAPADVSYYVDGRTGSDRNSGRSPRAAWRSIPRVNRATLGPGQRVLFAGGQTFRGSLRLTREDSGSPGRPVLLSSFGQGRAQIAAGAGTGLLVTGCAHASIRNLAFEGIGRKAGSNGSGIELRATRHAEVTDVEVSGFRIAGLRTSGDADSRITRVHAHDNGGGGIVTEGSREGLPRSQRLYIGYCRAENNPGDPKNLDNHSGNGIVVGGVDEALIEYCEATNNGWAMPRKGNGPVGIWGWNCDRLTIQHCISHHNKSPGMDGGGFDLDGGATNSVLQYNLSYGNTGTGYLLCQYPGAPPWKNNVVRYNLSIDDGAKNFHSGIGLWLGDRGMSAGEVYNNTIVNRRHAILSLNAVPGIVYRNNVLLAGGDVLVGDFSKSRFENNLFWRTGPGALLRDGRKAYRTLEDWASAPGNGTRGPSGPGVFADPRLILPGAGQRLPTDPRQIASMLYYRPLAGSPCLGAGINLPDAGGRDLFGNPVPSGGRPSLGACELPAPAASHPPADPGIASLERTTRRPPVDR